MYFMLQLQAVTSLINMVETVIPTLRTQVYIATKILSLAEILHMVLKLVVFWVIIMCLVLS